LKDGEGEVVGVKGNGRLGKERQEKKIEERGSRQLVGIGEIKIQVSLRGQQRRGKMLTRENRADSAALN